MVKLELENSEIELIQTALYALIEQDKRWTDVREKLKLDVSEQRNESEAARVLLVKLREVLR